MKLNLFQIKPKSRFATHTDSLLENKDYVRPISGFDTSETDDDVLNMAPEVRARPRCVMVK